MKLDGLDLVAGDHHGPAGEPAAAGDDGAGRDPPALPAPVQHGGHHGPGQGDQREDQAVGRQGPPGQAHQDRRERPRAQQPAGERPQQRAGMGAQELVPPGVDPDGGRGHSQRLAEPIGGHHGQRGLGLAGAALVEAQRGRLDGQGAVAHQAAQQRLLGRQQLHLGQGDLHAARGDQALPRAQPISPLAELEAPVSQQRGATGEDPARREGQQDDRRHGRGAELAGGLVRAPGVYGIDGVHRREQQEGDGSGAAAGEAVG